MSTRKKRVILILVAVVIAAAAIVIVVYQRQYAKTTDPAELKGLWATKEMWQGEELISEGPSATMIAIDKNGGYRFWDEGVDHVGMLSEKNGRLHFTGADGAAYALYGQGGELILLRELGDDQQKWIFARDGDYRDTQMTDQEFMEAYSALEKEAAEMTDEIYAGLYLGTKVKLLQEVDEENAILAARDGIVEKAAYVWYAEKEGIVVTDREVEAYMDDLISEIKDAEDFEAIDAAYKKAGLTFEESIRIQKRTYRMVCIMNKISKKHAKDWDAFKADLLKQYKETKDYDALQAKLDHAEEQLKTELVQPA